MFHKNIAFRETKEEKQTRRGRQKKQRKNKQKLLDTFAVSPLLSTYLKENKDSPSVKRKRKALIKILINNHGFPTK